SILRRRLPAALPCESSISSSANRAAPSGSRFCALSVVLATSYHACLSCLRIGTTEKPSPDSYASPPGAGSRNHNSLVLRDALLSESGRSLLTSSGYRFRREADLRRGRTALPVLPPRQTLRYGPAIGSS